MSCVTNLIFSFFFFTGSSPKNHHLIAVESFACPSEPMSCVVCCLLLVGVSHGKLLSGEGPESNYGSRRPMEDDGEKMRFEFDLEALS